MPPTVHPIVLTVGGSAGATSALVELTARLPPDFPLAVMVSVHVPAETESHLDKVLARRCVLPVEKATDRTPLRRGRITVAVPDRHLMLVGEEIRVVRGPKENGLRPAIDTLFRSAALAQGHRVIALLLSGTLDCGVRGLAAVKRLGGTALVQDPAEAEWPDMPRAAVESVAVDHVLPIAALPDKLVELARAPAPPAPVDAVLPDDLKAGTPTGLACPACGGALWDLAEAAIDHYICHVGHRYARRGLYSAKQGEIERMLYAALRGFQESVAILQRLAQRARERGETAAVESFRLRIAETAEHIQVLVSLIDDLRAEKA